jgi:hypothetical protein
MTRYLIATLLAVIVTASNAAAQICAGGYERSNRPFVMAKSTTPLALLARMQELASTSANESLSTDQRQAMENEFKADRDAVSQFGSRPRNDLPARTNYFLSQVINARFLGLDNLTIYGETDEVAQYNSREALNDVTLAIMDTLPRCLSGSWDRISMTGTSGVGRCEGAFSKRDSWLVGVDLLVASATLNTLKKYATKVANEPLSRSQADLVQDDFDYAVEGLYLRGKMQLFGISSQSQRFLTRVINPEYLGLSGIVMSMPFEWDRQAAAKASVVSISNAQTILRQCVRLGQ